VAELFERQVLSDARTEFLDRIKAGAKVHCPVCEKFCTKYERKLNSQMAIFLIKLVRRWERGGGWIDVKDLLHSTAGGKNSSDGTYLVQWDMIEAKASPNDPQHKESGIWRPTPHGVNFARNRVRAPRSVHLYNNHRLAYSPLTVNIVEALGEKFDYVELMLPTPLPADDAAATGAL